jgi:ABC-type sugar transport system ATPase subunit
MLPICDSIVTVKEGRITGDMPASEATEEKLMKLVVLGPGEEHVRVVLPAK